MPCTVHRETTRSAFPMRSDPPRARHIAGPRADQPDRGRRRLLTALAVAPLAHFSPLRAAVPQHIIAPVRAAVPQRIIALEWLPLEMLFALGVTPLGAADTHDYRLWVSYPPLPPGVLDVGRRSEPNLEYIAGLRPDLLLYSEGYGPRASQLQRIAPSMAFNFTNADGEPLRSVCEGIETLAQRIDREQAAQVHLAAFEQQLSAARETLAGFQRQPLLVFTFVDERHVVILGKSSLFGNVMARLGIENAWHGEDSSWGTATVGIERLATLPPVRAICLDHGDEAIRAQVATTPLWQAIPFVRHNLLRVVPTVWIFGATLSALRFCQMLQDQEPQW